MFPWNGFDEFCREKSKSTPEIAFLAQAALNKSRHYLFEKMIYHYGHGFWSDYEYYPGGFCLWNINYRHLDISTDERIREAENPANDASPPMHGRRPLFLRRVSNLQPRVNNCPQCKICISSRPPQNAPQRKRRPNKNPSMAPKPTRHHPTTTPW